MGTLENIKTDLVDFVWSKLTLTTWMFNSKCTRQTTTKHFAWSKNSRWEKQISTGSYDWGISWSLQQTLVERKACHQCCYQQPSKTWMNNSNWLTRWLKQWTKQIERLVWLCCSTMWKSQRVQMFNSDYQQIRSRKTNFNKLLMWIVHLKNIFIYLMQWILYMIKVLL